MRRPHADERRARQAPPGLSRRTLVGLGLWAALGLRLSAGARGARAVAGTGPAASGRGTLRMTHALEWAGKESLDPASSNRMFPAIDLLYSRLVRPDERGRPTPDLAITWEADPTARSWTFRLRDGVRFHDGRRLEAGDVVETLRHVVDPALGSPGAAALQIIDTARLRATDGRTVVITLSKPHADLPVLMQHYACYVLPAGRVGSIARPGVGTGPFRMETFEPEGTTVLVAHDAYFGGRPALARIEVVGIADQEARVNALLADQIDFLGGFSAAAVDVVHGDRRFVVHEVPTGTWATLSMRTDRPPFDRLAVRQALKLVADRPGLIKVALAGHGTVASDHPVWPGDPYSLERRPTRDVARARSLLSGAGFPSGIDVDLHTAPVTDGTVALAVAYAEMAAEAGIRVSVRQVSSDGYWNNVWRKETFFCSWWGERPADQVLAELFRTGATWNETAWSHPGFEGLLDRARAELDFGRRRALYQEAQRLVAEEGGAIIPYFRNQLRAMHRRVKGIGPGQREIDWAKVRVE